MDSRDILQVSHYGDEALFLCRADWLLWFCSGSSTLMKRRSCLITSQSSRSSPLLTQSHPLNEAAHICSLLSEASAIIIGGQHGINLPITLKPKLLYAALEPLLTSAFWRLLPWQQCFNYSQEQMLICGLFSLKQTNFHFYAVQGPHSKCWGGWLSD